MLLKKLIGITTLLILIITEANSQESNNIKKVTLGINATPFISQLRQVAASKNKDDYKQGLNTPLDFGYSMGLYTDIKIYKNFYYSAAIRFTHLNGSGGFTQGAYYEQLQVSFYNIDLMPLSLKYITQQNKNHNFYYGLGVGLSRALSGKDNILYKYENETFYDKTYNFNNRNSATFIEGKAGIQVSVKSSMQFIIGLKYNYGIDMFPASLPLQYPIDEQFPIQGNLRFSYSYLGLNLGLKI